MSRARWVILGAIAVVSAAGCGRTRDDEARDALLHVEDAQFYRTEMPAGETGPKVTSVTVAGVSRAGLVGQSFAGELEPSANATAVMLDGDVGYWIVPAGIPSTSAPTLPTFQGVFAIATAAPSGPRTLTFRAVDGEGHFGPPVSRPLTIAPPRSADGRLVIALSWNNQADLDLHVVLPSGAELFKRNRTEYERPPPSAGPVPPGSPTDGGFLDRDSNAGCTYDGQRAENAIWSEAPPKGRYTVRVDTFSLCGEATAISKVEARLDGVRIGAAEGVSTETDLRYDHNRGGGVLALELDVP